MCDASDTEVFSISRGFRQHLKRQRRFRASGFLLFLMCSLVSLAMSFHQAAFVCGAGALGLFYSWWVCRRFQADIDLGLHDISVETDTVHLPLRRRVRLSDIDEIAVKTDRRGKPLLAVIVAPTLKASIFGPGQLLDFHRYEDGGRLLAILQRRAR